MEEWPLPPPSLTRGCRRAGGRHPRAVCGLSSPRWGPPDQPAPQPPRLFGAFTLPSCLEVGFPRRDVHMSRTHRHHHGDARARGCLPSQGAREGWALQGRSSWRSAGTHKAAQAVLSSPRPLHLPSGGGLVSAARRWSCSCSAVSLRNKLATSLPATVVAAESTGDVREAAAGPPDGAWPRQHWHRGDEPKGNPGRCPPRPEEGTGFLRQGATKDHCRHLINPLGVTRRSRPAPRGTLPVCHGEGPLGSEGREGALPAVSDSGCLSYTSCFRESG